MKRRFCLAAALVLLSACSADSIVEKKLQEQYEQALAAGNDCLASAIASQIIRATDASDNLRPSISQTARWDKWGDRSGESAAKCKQRYEQAVAAGDHCVLANAAENYATLIQLQGASHGPNLSMDQALLVADLRAQAAGSNEACQLASSGQQTNEEAAEAALAGGGDITNDGALLAGEAPAQEDSVQADSHSDEQDTEIAQDSDSRTSNEAPISAGRSSGGYAGMMSDMAARRIDSAQPSDQDDEITKIEVVSPSFNCAKAMSSPEKAICDRSSLAVLDVKMAALYKRARVTSRDVFDTDWNQRAWIRGQRDVCGADVACLTKAYQERIEALSSL